MIAFAKVFEKGDEMRPAIGPTVAQDEMGTETSVAVEFTDSEIIYTIRQDPGPTETSSTKWSFTPHSGTMSREP